MAYSLSFLGLHVISNNNLLLFKKNNTVGLLFFLSIMTEVPPEVHILTKVLISIIEQQYFSLHPTITLVYL